MLGQVLPCYILTCLNWFVNRNRLQTNQLRQGRMIKLDTVPMGTDYSYPMGASAGKNIL